MVLFAMEMGSMIAYAIMAVFFVAMVWALSASKKDPSKKILFFVFFALVIVTLVVKTVFIKDANSEDERLVRNTKLMQMSRVEKVASYISEKWPNGKVAFLVNAIQMQEQTEADLLDKFMVSELKKILTDKGLTVLDEDIAVGKMVKNPKTGDEEYEDPLQNTSVLAKALKPQIDKVDVVVNFVGLPEKKGEVDNIPYLAKKVSNGKNNMIVMVDQGLVQINEKMIDSGRVVYVVSSPDELEFDFQKMDVPKDSEETFKMFFTWIDKEGFQVYKEKSPSLFEKLPED